MASTGILKIREVLRMKDGCRVAVRGWVYRWRDLGSKVFVVVRDSTGIIQAVFAGEAADGAREADIEAAVVVEGVLKSDPRAPGGREIVGEKIAIIGPSHSFPITRDVSREFLLDVRHLWIRSRRMSAVMKVRHTVFGALHEYFRSRGYYEVQCPMFITAAVEGGATLFQLDYVDGSKVYLTQSSQFYLEALIYSLEKVYTIAPSFRAEKSRTRRHLTEFWHCEAELAWASLEDVMKVEEELVWHVIQKVLEENREELSMLGRKVELLERCKPPFYRISYDEAVEILQNRGIKVEWGEDFGADEERELVKEFDKPVFVHRYPERVKAFYHKSDPKRPEVTLSADLLAPEGYGEIIGGGERISELGELLEKIKRFGLRPEDYEWYIDLRRYGSVPHAGFGLGVDRTVMWIAGLDHIVDAIPFPRTIRRVYP
ncbi:MAG: asparagine--tRNA ligase [Thermoprotei archaeon]|nr:MAG: asparagine--tRNA ligase [Thermoprotei archaeon]